MERIRYQPMHCCIIFDTQAFAFLITFLIIFPIPIKKGLRIRHIFNRRFQIISGTLNMIPHTDVIRLFPMIHDYLRRVFIFVS